MWQRWLACAGIYSGGELICNYITQRPRDYDRTLRIVAWGSTADSIFLRRFHHIVERRLPNPLLRMACEQLCYSPVSNASYLTIVKQGFSWTFDDWAHVYTHDCTFWPLVSFIGYRLVPLPARFLYVSTASLVWNVWRSANV